MLRWLLPLLLALGAGAGLYLLLGGRCGPDTETGQEAPEAASLERGPAIRPASIERPVRKLDPPPWPMKGGGIGV